MCDCKEKVEAMVLAEFKESRKNWEDHQVSLDGYELSYSHKKNSATWSSGSISATCIGKSKNSNPPLKAFRFKRWVDFKYCPFCGIEYKL